MSAIIFLYCVFMECEKKRKKEREKRGKEGGGRGEEGERWYTK
jgi:hypothetical protein